ncbi:MAG: glycosyltransferase family 4 protein [Spirochaetales bacterium]|nr:glycosyltransferase family 4 protein [Spirochaetales bacterium]
MSEKAATKQNILIVHNRYKYRGGEDTVVENERQLLESNGHKVVTYIRDNSELDKMSKFQKLLLPLTTLYSRRTVRDIKRIIREHNIDVVHVHNTVPLISPSVYAAAKSCGCKVVQTLHNFRFICPNGLMLRDGRICDDCIRHGLKCAVKHKCYRSSKIQTLMLVTMLRLHRLLGTYRKVDKYIALTEFNKQLLCSALPKLFTDSNVAVKPNFCFGSGAPTAAVSALEREYFLFCGRVEESKGIFDLIEVFASMSEQRLIILGTGSDFDRAVDCTKQLNCANITFLGQCVKPTVMEYMSHAKCLIVPSKWYEGFPMTIAEAFSVGTPVMAADIGNAGELANMSAGTLPHDDIAQWPTLIRRLCEDAVLQTEIDKAYALYKERYSDAVNYKILLNIYGDSETSSE